MEIKLRPWILTDLDDLVRYANNPKIADNLMDAFPHPYGVENGRAFIFKANQPNPTRILAIIVDGAVVGSIGLHPKSDIERKNAELGYWLAEPFWGQGITTEAVRQMVQYGFECLPIERIFARPFGPNKASQRVLEKAGFTLEAHFKQTLYKNGVYLDELIYAIRRSDSLTT